MGSRKFLSNLENRFAAMEITTDVNHNLENMVQILREEVMRFCQMQRKGKGSKYLEKTLGLVKEKRENPLLTSPAKRTLNRDIRKLICHDLQSSNARSLTIERVIEQNQSESACKISWKKSSDEVDHRPQQVENSLFSSRPHFRKWNVSMVVTLRMHLFLIPKMRTLEAH